MEVSKIIMEIDINYYSLAREMTSDDTHALNNIVHLDSNFY